MRIDATQEAGGAGCIGAPSRFGARSLLVAAIALGSVLRIWQYAANSSLWLDELALANNVLRGSLLDLVTQPLDFAQVAPLGYVLLLKAVGWFGGTELQLRLYAFVCGQASLVFTALLAKESLGIGYAWAPTLLVALSPSLIHQAAQVKPYSGDCLLVAACLLYAVRTSNSTAPRNPRRWGAFFVIAPWFSFPVLFGLGAVALAVAAPVARRTVRTPSRAALGMVLAVILSSVASVGISLTTVSPATRAFMNGYWARGFPSFPPQSPSDFVWPIAVVTDLLQVLGLGDFRGAGILTLITILGMVSLARTHGRRMAILLAPFGSALLAAALNQYPLAGRVALWTLPVIAIFVVAGARSLAVPVPRRFRAVTAAMLLAAVVALPALRLVNRPLVQRWQHVRPLIEHLVEASRPGDVVYIYYGAWHAWTYYAPRLGATALPVVLGGCSRVNRGEPLSDLRNLEGHDRAWIVISHAERQLRERTLIADFLRAVGARLIWEGHEPSPFADASETASVLLYDLRRARFGRPDADRAVSHVLDANPGPPPGCWPPLLPPFLDRSHVPPV